jgi:CBS domain containing-hemolysin-like protein
MRRSRVAEMVQAKNLRRQDRFSSLQQTMDRSVAGAQLGITICGLAVGGVGQEPIRSRAAGTGYPILWAMYWPWFAAAGTFL